ncbi:hypothetical protein [Candidatus Palauibacter sp.]|uniref:hypothetical protein n=1 Tax=Candidatus Palauibacter sp. TaxID=3101350 RepID=UPI003B596233
MKRWVALLAFPGLVLALPLRAQVGVHGGVAMDLWDRDAGYEETYFLAGVSWAPGAWEYRVSAAALVLQSDSSLRIGGEVSVTRRFFRGRRLEPLLGLGATVYRTDTMPHEETGIGLAPLLIAGADLSITRNLRFRLEYRGVYGIFPSMFAGLSFGSRSR